MTESNRGPARRPDDTHLAAIADALAGLTGDLADLAADLVRMPSVGGSAAEAATTAWVQQWAVGQGLSAEVIDVAAVDLAGQPGYPGMEVDRERVTATVIDVAGDARIPGLLLLGHVDVVPADAGEWTAEPFHPRWVGAGDALRLVGRGAVDMKAGMAAALIAGLALRRSGIALAAPVAVAAVTGEEDGGTGTFALLSHLAGTGRRFSACVIPEPTGLRPVTANGGSLTFRLTVPGVAAHGAMRWQGHNPLDSLGPVLAALHVIEEQQNAGPDPRMSPWPIPYPLSVGTVNGGDWASTVPADLEITGRFGVRLGQTPQQARALFESLLARQSAADPWLAAHPCVVQWWGGEFAPADCDPGHPLVAAVEQAHREVVGSDTGPSIGAPYGSDMRLMIGLGGVPTLLYGPGDIALAHAVDESVPWPDVVVAAEVLAIAALHYVGVAAD